MKISVVICTRDRAEDLKATLAAMRSLKVPTGDSAELIIVDNGSKDATSSVVQQADLAQLDVRYVLEPNKGLSRARNRGLKTLTGDIVLFTDDDVRVPENWIERMCAPLLANTADIVCGGVHIAPHLLRSWMEPIHKTWLASTDTIATEDTKRAVGANMAFKADILSRVPAFDVELGAGTALAAEEALFSFQVQRAGFRFAYNLDVAVEHHFQESRLKRDSFIGFAQTVGRGSAYLIHHWDHISFEDIDRMLLKSQVKMVLERLRGRYKWNHPEGVSLSEMLRVVEVCKLRHFKVERLRERNYEKHGLVKLKGVIDSSM